MSSSFEALLKPTTGDLSGEVAIVTGVNGRLGGVWARALLAAGAFVVGIDLLEQPPHGLVERLNVRPSGPFKYLRGDVRDIDSLSSALDTCLAASLIPSIIVNNAGVDSPPESKSKTWTFFDYPDALSTSVMDANALGVLRVCQVFGRPLVERGRGSVINVGSLYGNVAPDPRMYDHLDVDPPFLKPPAYGMSKAALGSVTRYLAALWGPSGVRVNVLSPGGVRGSQDDAFIQKFSSRVPLGRLADVEDLIGPLLFLASSQSNYVTGTELCVDGGFQCW